MSMDSLISSERPNQAPQILRSVDEFRRTFVRFGDWIVWNDPRVWGLLFGVAMSGWALAWVMRGGHEIAGQAGLVCGMATIAGCMQGLKAVHAQRVLRRLESWSASTLDEAKRRWIALHFNAHPRDYIALAQRLLAWREMGATLSVVGVTPVRVAASGLGQDGQRATAWAVAFVTVSLPLVFTNPVMRDAVFDFVFANTIQLTVLLLIFTGYAIFLFRGVPVVMDGLRELLGHLGLLRRGWPLDFLLRELVRLAEPIQAQNSLRPAARPTDGWVRI